MSTEKMFEQYATWAVKLWIDNEQPSQEYWNERATEIAKKYFDSDDIDESKEGAITDLRKELQSEFENGMPEIENGPFLDLLSAALKEVNWHNIARDMIDEIWDEMQKEI